MSDLFRTHQQERAGILMRLRKHRTIYCARSASREAALDLERDGMVRCWPGTGLDEGLLLVELCWSASRTGPPGGSAA